MRVTLVYPAIEKKVGKKYLRSWQMEPLAMALLARLTPEDVQIRFYDDRIEEIPFQENTDLVGISVETYAAKRAYEIASQFRERKIPVVLGGYHPTLAPEDALEHSDSIVVGNAEGIWEKVIEDARHGEIKRIYQGGRDKNLVFALPQRDIFSGKRYLPIALLEAGRGCRFRCDFCSVTAYHRNQFFRRPIEDIIGEVRKLKKNLIFFVDDNIIGDIPSAKKLFEALIPEKIKWIGQCSVNAANDDELIRLMARSGCVGLLIGLESLDMRNIGQMGKDQNAAVANYSNLLGKLRNSGIIVYGTFVFGYDQDDISSTSRAVQFGIQEKLFIAAFNHLVPFPGTPLYERLKKEGRIPISKWWLDPNYRFGDISFLPKNIGSEKLTEMCVEARKKFFSLPLILKRAADFKANCKNFSNARLFLFANFLLRREVNLRRNIRLGTR